MTLFNLKNNLNIKYNNMNMNMINYLVKFFNTNRKTNFYSRTYREGYNKLWINNIRDYSP